MKNKNCKICGEYSLKRNVCLECKEKYPYSASPSGSLPFIRARLREKEKRK